MFLFREPLGKLIGRTSAVRFPGVEWSTSQAERTADASAAPASPVVTGATDPPAAPAGLTQEQQTRIADIIRAESARAFLWEYRFLNFYLVPHTQRVLDWFGSLQQRPTLHFYGDLWSSTIYNIEERSAVLNALLDHGLVQATGPLNETTTLLEITLKGREYLQFRGPLARLHPLAGAPGPVPR